MTGEAAIGERLARAHWLRDHNRHQEAIAELGSDAGDEPRLATARAMLAYEAWLPATAWLERALVLSPGDRQLVRNLAGSLIGDGRFPAGEELLVTALAKEPDWVEGQFALAQARTTHGASNADRGFGEAFGLGPMSATLSLAWFQWLAKARQWDKARDVLDRAERAYPGHRGMMLSRLFVEAESGASRDPRLFDPAAELGDPGTDLGRVRHALRLGDPAAVEGIAARHEGQRAGRMFWPYRSLAWRLLGDDRAAWLERPEIAVCSHDLGYDPAGLARLADFVRSLHVTAAPQIDQSVRSGTQTERSILLHHDPIIGELRARLAIAIDRHIDALPDAVEGHPWLATARTNWRIAGSWSVRLGPGGHHVPHTHPDGWFSSALHLALPDTPDGEGALLFGGPPAELGLELSPTLAVEPVAGVLQLFPSTTWHSTAPIRAGERLTLAFDVAVPHD